MPIYMVVPEFGLQVTNLTVKAPDSCYFNYEAHKHGGINAGTMSAYD